MSQITSVPDPVPDPIFSTTSAPDPDPDQFVSNVFLQQTSVPDPVPVTEEKSVVASQDQSDMAPVLNVLDTWNINQISESTVGGSVLAVSQQGAWFSN